MEHAQRNLEHWIQGRFKEKNYVQNTFLLKNTSKARPLSRNKLLVAN